MASPQQRLCHVVLVVMVTLLLTDAKSAKQKPASDYFTLCSRKDVAKLNACVFDNINALRTKLTTGIPELKLVPMDPMNIPRMVLSEGQGNFRFQQKLSNLTIHGLSQFQTKSIDYKLDPTEMRVKMVMFTPSMKMTADYEMSGQILVLPIRGNGDCVLDFTDVTTVANVLGKVVKRNGDEYIDVVEVKWDINVGSAKSQFNNLFNGDKLLGDATNNFLNQNWKDAFQTYKHLPEEAFGVVFKDLTGQVFKRYSIKELFLD